MTGIVVVSHSHALAVAAVALAREMAPGPLPIEVAAGVDTTTFGTDAVAIAHAIERADDGQGVLVLMDLGSAVLSTDLALELLADEVRDRVRLSPAPLVEGLLAAAVAASGGASGGATADQIAAEAADALAGKQAQLGEPPGTGTTDHSPPDRGPSDPASVERSPTGVERWFTVLNPHGLHARPAARLVRQLRAFDADVRLRNLTTGSADVSALSLSRLASLGALRGHQVAVRATGPQAAEAVDHVLALAGRGFDDLADDPADEPGPSDRPAVTPPTTVGPTRPAAPLPAAPLPAAPLPAVPRPGDRLVGLCAAPGIVIGPVWTPQPTALDTSAEPATDPTEELRRLDSALARVIADVERIRNRVRAELGATEAEIFDAHLALLDDPDLLADIRARIGGGQAAPAAWVGAIADAERTLASIDDPYQAARAADVRAVGDQVLRAMSGGPADTTTPYGVLVAADLSPAEVVALEPARVTAVLLAFGSPTSHAAILARSRDLPLVTGLGPTVLAVPAGTEVGVDAGRGLVEVAPDPARRAALREAAETAARSRARAVAAVARPAITRDGLQIQVGVNLGSPADARAAAGSGADLAGLVRTEFVFGDRDTAPDVDEQVAAYLTLAEALDGRRLTLRTLDVGGDKPLRYDPGPVEHNPFLGVRGLRRSLAHPVLFRDQLRAIVRTARQVPVSVMFPMVSTVTELRQARRLLDEVIAAEGGSAPAGLLVGIMVEVPAVALKAAAFAPYVDFFSIGTNDLTQYALAAERGNDAVAHLGDAYDPGVLSLIHSVCLAAAGGPVVAVCGELAGDPLATALLVGLGVQELSVAAPAVATIKESVRAVDARRAEVLAGAALHVAGPAEVRAMLAGDV